MELQLVANARSTSLVIPALAFESEAQAFLYCRRLPNELLEHPLLVVHGGRGRCYVQRPEKRFRNMTCSDMLARNTEFLRRPLPLSVRIEPASLKRRYHVCLFREGKGQFSRMSSGESQEIPRWCLPFLRSEKDCYAAWEHALPGRRLPRYPQNDADAPSACIRVGRKAVGAIYTREVLIGRNGDISGIRTTIVAIRAEVIQSNRPAVLRVRMKRLQRCSDSLERPREPDVRSIPSSFHELIERARRGYIAECVPMKPETLNRHRFLLEQIDRDTEDDDKGDKGYAAAIEHLPWETALAMAREPWQFAVVADLHADERFDNGRPRTRRNRILHMIRKSSLDASRKRVLEIWLEDYLARVEDDIDAEPT
ncbi:hypothetical protein KJZ71_04410 [Patescibacteria group bacterium]|nr:hypothetical protein [Patescibacteria group bacterium]MDL1953287.1 hypothetical protein [Candidatus Uhrbacteria bacterium UHB]RIL00517.1 MAG: hypothetical protein DCC77_03060 [Candidatus Uhrbacteria bacterium]